MDQLTLINKALLKCGLPLAAALSDCDWNASMIFESASQEVFRSYTWGFATIYTVLGQSGKPSHAYTYAYTLPEDCARIIDVRCHDNIHAPKASYNRSGKKLYTHVAPCYLRYVSHSIPVSQWPPDFCDAVACAIAKEIAPLSTQTAAMKPQLMQEYALALATAQATDARECMERVPMDVNILASRAVPVEAAGKE